MSGRGIPAPVHIIPAYELLGQDQIRAEIMRYTNLPYKTTLECIQWLAKRRLLRNSYQCQCGILMSFTRREQSSDGYIWKCKDCGITASIRSNSFVRKSHLSLDQLIAIIYGWSRDYSQRNIAHEAELSERSHHTIVDWCLFCRNICKQYLADHPVIVGGLNDDGTSKVVEIGEPKFFQWKYYRGLGLSGNWMFGGVERETEKYFLVEVADHSTATLSAIIQRYILPGTIIVSDGWSLYSKFKKIGGGLYEHHAVIQGEEKDRNDPVIRIRSVENMWMRAKRKLRRQFGTSETLFASYLYEFIWRSKFKHSNTFAEFLICIAEQYPV